MMSNSQALEQLLSMWAYWKKDKNTKFDHGLTKFKNMFQCLKDIRRWDVQDRLFETGILDAWQEDLKHDGNHLIQFEIELWFRKIH